VRRRLDCEHPRTDLVDPFSQAQRIFVAAPARQLIEMCSCFHRRLVRGEGGPCLILIGHVSRGRVECARCTEIQRARSAFRKCVGTLPSEKALVLDECLSGGERHVGCRRIQAELLRLSQLILTCLVFSARSDVGPV
jgi:hypothetical protein